MKKSNKKLVSVLLVFALVFISGGVYAATSGVLAFKGVANLNEAAIVNDLMLELHDSKTQPNAISNDGLSTGTMSITPDRQTADIVVNLDKPGSEVFFTFDVKNTGTLDAYLFEFKTNSKTHNDLNAVLEFTGSYKNLEDMVINTGNDVRDLTFGIKWKEGAEGFAGEQVNFQVSIAYIENP
ncbi:MAG: hypothetical protein FWH05_00145 [Oscillospiraceae bacterium]|nr:hypothetical protein [Oscillospiraceae bacterium]